MQEKQQLLKELENLPEPENEYVMDLEDVQAQILRYQLSGHPLLKQENSASHHIELTSVDANILQKSVEVLQDIELVAPNKIADQQILDNSIQCYAANNQLDPQHIEILK